MYDFKTFFTYKILFNSYIILNLHLIMHAVFSVVIWL